VHQVGHCLSLYQDARSAKHKKCSHCFNAIVVPLPLHAVASLLLYHVLYTRQDESILVNTMAES